MTIYVPLEIRSIFEVIAKYAELKKNQNMELAIQLEQTKKEAVSGGFGPLGWLNHITPSVFV